MLLGAMDQSHVRRGFTISEEGMCRESQLGLLLFDIFGLPQKPLSKEFCSENK